MKKNKRKKSKFKRTLSFIFAILLLIIICYSQKDRLFGNQNNSIESSQSIPLPEGKEVKLSAKDDQEGNLEIFFFQLENESSQSMVGDAIYLKYGDIDILIDAGVQYIGSNIVKPYLEEKVTDKVIELCINTHTDLDHIGGFVGLKKDSAYTGVMSTSCKINYFIDSGYEASTEIYKNYKSERDKLVNNGTSYYSYEQTMTHDNIPSKYILGTDTYIELLDSKIYENNFSGSNDVNDYSVPLILHHGKTSFLLMGDCEKKAEENVLKYNNLPEVDFFKANHHGSPTSNTKGLLDVIKPDYIIIDATKENKYNLPKKEIVDRFLNYTQEIYAPFINGGIHVYSDKEKLSFDCDGYIDYTSGVGILDENTKGTPIKLQTTSWYQNAV